MSKKELTYADFSLPIPKKRYQTLVHHANYHPRAKEQAFKSCASLHFIHSPRDNTKNHLQEREIPKMLKDSENFSQVLMTIGELC
jgi:hypothetical protein